jgi:hypothetical protein
MQAARLPLVFRLAVGDADLPAEDPPLPPPTTTPAPRVTPPPTLNLSSAGKKNEDTVAGDGEAVSSGDGRGGGRGLAVLGAIGAVGVVVVGVGWGLVRHWRGGQGRYSHTNTTTSRGRRGSARAQMKQVPPGQFEAAYTWSLRPHTTLVA